MKTIIVLFSALMLLASCGRPPLDNTKAMGILEAEKRYPRTVDYDLYCADPAHAKKVLDAGLEEKGLLRVQRTQKLGEMGAPLIQFTQSAEAYLLPTPEKDKTIHVQKIKMANEVLEAVQSVTISDDGKSATVSYSTRYADFTPFNVLRTAPSDNKRYTVQFVLTNKGWQVDRKK